VLESPIRRSQLALTAMALLLLGASHRALIAQVTIAPAATPVQPPKAPLSILYLQFFMYEAHLEHRNETHPIANPSGKPLKEHLRLKIGLSPEEWQSVTASSLRIEAHTRALAAQAKPLADANREACQGRPSPCTPPNLSQINALRKQRMQTVIAEAKSLESSLGQDSTTKLRGYLQTDLATHITLKPAVNSRSQSPGQTVKGAIQ